MMTDKSYQLIIVFLSQNCDAQYVYCQKNNVALTISNLMKELKEKISKPYYINGNEFGTGNETVPVNAYYKVYEEICNQEQKLNIKYDYIFVALGTGMTYSGLMSGKIANNDSSHNIIGISIARNTDQCREKIESYASKFLDIKGIDISEEELKERILISVMSFF